VIEASKFLKERWPRRSTPVFVILLIFLAVLFFASSVKLSTIEWEWWLILLLTPPVVIFVWWKTTHVPTTPKNKVGFLVAIVHEDPSKRTSFRNDFVQVLRELLQGGDLRYQFRLIELSEFHSSKIMDLESAERFLRASRSRFMLYGRIRERSVDGKIHHFLNLNGMVAHRPIPGPVSTAFSNEFGALLPRKVQIAQEGDIFAFEFTAQWAELVSRYIIGVASLLSGDHNYASDLFEGVKARLADIKDTVLPIATLRMRLPDRLETAYSAEIMSCYSVWQSTHEMSLMVKMNVTSQKLLDIRPDNYLGHLIAAMCAFVLNRDIKKAKREIKHCRTMKDRTWYFDKAFLYAYEGEMKSAIAAYSAAFARPPVDLSVPLQSERFIIYVLGLEEDKVQLYYCLGMINLLAKRDMMAARRDFGEFIARCPKDKFNEERSSALSYLRKLDEDTMTGPAPN
jgi:tetratricopeptide (TPR) repeat protein